MSMRMPLAEIDGNSQEKNSEAPETSFSPFCFLSQQKSEKKSEVAVQSLSANDESLNETEAVILSSAEVKQQQAKKRKSPIKFPIKSPIKEDEDVTCAICSCILNSFTLPEREAHVNSCMDKKVSKKVKKSKNSIKSEVPDDDADSDFAEIFSPKSSLLLVASKKVNSKKVRLKVESVDGRSSKSTTDKHRGKKILSLGEAEQIEHVKALSLSEVNLINNLREGKLGDSESDTFVTSSSPSRSSGNSSKDKNRVKFIKDDGGNLGRRSVNETLMGKATKSQQKSSNKHVTDEDELQRLRLLLSEISAREATDRVQKAQTLKTIRKIMKKPKKIVIIDINESAQDVGPSKLSAEEMEAIDTRNSKSLELATDILFPFPLEDQKDNLYSGSDHNSGHCQQDGKQNVSSIHHKVNDRNNDTVYSKDEDRDKQSMDRVLAVLSHCPLWGLAQHREMCDRSGDGFKMVSKAFHESCEGLDGCVLVDEGEDWADSQPDAKDHAILNVPDIDEDGSLVGHSHLPTTSPPKALCVPSCLSSPSSTRSIDELNSNGIISMMPITLLIRTLIDRLTSTALPHSITSSTLSSSESPLLCMLSTLYRSLANAETDDIGHGLGNRNSPDMRKCKEGHLDDDGSDRGLSIDDGNNESDHSYEINDNNSTDMYITNTTDHAEVDTSIQNSVSMNNYLDNDDDVAGLPSTIPLDTTDVLSASPPALATTGFLSASPSVLATTDILSTPASETPQCSSPHQACLKHSSNMHKPEIITEDSALSVNRLEGPSGRGLGLVQLSLAIPNSPFPGKDSLLYSGIHSLSLPQLETALYEDGHIIPFPLPLSFNPSSFSSAPLSPSDHQDSDFLPLPLPISSMRDSDYYNRDQGNLNHTNEDKKNVPIKTTETNFADFEFKDDLELPIPLPLSNNNGCSGNDDDSAKIRNDNCNDGQIKSIERNRSNDCENKENCSDDTDHNSHICTMEGGVSIMNRTNSTNSTNSNNSGNNGNNDSQICTMEGGVSVMNKTNSTSSNNSNNDSNDSSQICTLEGGVSIMNKTSAISGNNSRNNSQLCTFEGGVSVNNMRDSSSSSSSEGTDINDSNSNIDDNNHKYTLEGGVSHIDTKSQPAIRNRKVFDTDDASKITLEGCKIGERELIEVDDACNYQRSKKGEGENEINDNVNYDNYSPEYEGSDGYDGNIGNIEPVKIEMNNYLDLCLSTPSTSQKTPLPLTPLGSITKNDCDESQTCCLEGGHSFLKNNNDDSNNDTPNSHVKPFCGSPSSNQSHSQYSASWEPSPSILFSPKEDDDKRLPYKGNENEDHLNDITSPSKRETYSESHLLEDSQGMKPSRVVAVVGVGVGVSPGCTYEELEAKLERLQRAAKVLQSDDEEEQIQIEGKEEDEDMYIKEEINKELEGGFDGYYNDRLIGGNQITETKPREGKTNENVSREVIAKTEAPVILEERKIKEEVILTVDNSPDKRELMHSQRVRTGVRTGVKRPLASAFYKPPSNPSCSSSSRIISAVSSSASLTRVHRNNDGNSNDYPRIQIDVRDISMNNAIKGDIFYDKSADDNGYHDLNGCIQIDQHKSKDKGGWGGWNSPKKVMTADNGVTNISRGKSSKSLKKKNSAVGGATEAVSRDREGQRERGEVVADDDEDAAEFFYGTQKQKDPISMEEKDVVAKKAASREPLDLTGPHKSILSSSLPSRTPAALIPPPLPHPVAIADMFKSTNQPNFDVYTISELHQFGALYGLKKDTKSRLVKILESMWRRTQLQSSTASTSTSSSSLPSTKSSSSSSALPSTSVSTLPSSSSSCPSLSGPSNKLVQEKESSTSAVSVAAKAIRKPRAKKAPKTQENVTVTIANNLQEIATLNVEKITKKRKKCSKNDVNDPEQLNNEVMEYIRNEPDLYMEVICFEPLDVDALHRRLNKNGKIIMKDELVNILDANALFISRDCVAKQRSLDRKNEKKEKREQKKQLEIQKDLLKNNEKRQKTKM